MEDSKRLLMLIDHLKENPNSFSKKIGLDSNTRVRHVLNGRNGLSPNFAKIIINYYPEVSYEWLVNGKGNMLANNTSVDNLSIENIVNFLYKLPQAELDNNETWQLFLETQYQNIHLKKVAQEIEKLQKDLEAKLLKN